MAQITFLGDPRAPGTDPDAVEVFGVRFRLGEAVEVSDETLAAKLARHSHFKIEAPEPAAKPVESVEPPDAAALLAQADSMRFLVFKSAAAKLGAIGATKADILAALQALAQAHGDAV